MFMKAKKLLLVLLLIHFNPMIINGQIINCPSHTLILDEKLNFLPVDYIEKQYNKYGEKNGHLSDLWKQYNLGGTKPIYFCWNMVNDQVILPSGCAVLRNLQSSLLDNLCDSLRSTKYDKKKQLLLSTREMMIFKLDMVKKGADFDEMNNFYERRYLPVYNFVRFHIFEYEINKKISCKYLTYSPPKLEHSIYYLTENSEDLYNYLVDIKKSGETVVINICFQGYICNIPIGILDFCLKYGEDDYCLKETIGINPPEMKKARLEMKPLVGTKNIHQLRSCKIIFDQDGKFYNFNTRVYGDLLYKSSVERRNENSTFVLTYFKTHDFPWNSVNLESDNEIDNYADFLMNYYNSYTSSDPYHNYSIYLNFTGYADIIKSKDMTEKDWRDKNKKLSLNRANKIRSSFIKKIKKINSLNKKILIADSTSIGCDESYYNGNDRSVEIKAWIR